MKAEFQIEDVFMITGRGTVLTGRIISGTIKNGDYILIEKKRYLISGIEMSRMASGMLNKGDNVGLLVKGISKEEAKSYRRYICDVVDIAELRNNKIDDILGEDSI